MKGVTAWMPAAAPGGVQHDLYRAGYIQHPHRDLNSLSCEWVEHRWWMYRTSFPRPAHLGRKVELVCKGLDYKAHVYLNNVPLGEHEGMFVPAVFDITDIARTHETLELRILFEHAPQEQSQIGRTSLTHTQKSRFGYKWDFSARLVPLGIWDDVYLRVHEELSLGEAHVRTDVAEDGTGVVGLKVRVEGGGDGGGYADGRGSGGGLCRRGGADRSGRPRNRDTADRRRSGAGGGCLFVSRGKAAALVSERARRAAAVRARSATAEGGMRRWTRARSSRAFASSATCSTRRVPRPRCLIRLRSTARKCTSKG
ncbi:hypothetical protein OMP38_09690 [Cohnella ginsengisoli]|uniref:Beta-mannosidase-like galactose-binding domain-containing protein n=1 Tax=Cohnella ginsengisoli TaxID=425004 RepID=A0A9X4KFF2_9BACL|nr:hypothetical protein [Cohnella ginsengisoli]MDG0791112.1 hypothetical protein [Cohnella ginsengisoli]